MSISFIDTRGDDFDEEFAYQLATGGTHILQIDNEYYDELHLDDMDNDYESHKVDPDEQAADAKSVSSGSFQDVPQLEKREDGNDGNDGNDVNDECEASSSLYAAQDVPEPVDFENNGVLWLPPEPEDEEDEREALLYDDDEDDDVGNAAGEWGYLRSSSNLGSGECRNRERSNEEHKKAMKTVVDGHFRALVSQLLQVENLVSSEEEDDKDNWLEIITSLSWEAASLLKPDTSKGGGMDPGGYVKIKCLASGRRSDRSGFLLAIFFPF